MANKLFISENYMVAHNDTDSLIGEYSLGNTIYREESDKFILKEEVDRGELKILKSDIDSGEWLDSETGGDPYTQASLRTFLRSNTGFSGGRGGGSETTRNLPANSVVSFPEVTKDCYIFGSAEIFQFSKVPEVQILTPEYQRTDGSIGPIGNLGANMVDNNRDNICYNNFGAATAVNLPFYTFDFGAPVALDRLVIDWWQLNTYIPDDFRIEASNDFNGAFTTIIDNLDALNLADTIQNIDIADNTPYQYWRIFTYSERTGQLFIVCNEQIPQQAGIIFESIESSDNFNIYFDQSGILQVESFYDLDASVTIRYQCP